MTRYFFKTAIHELLNPLIRPKEYFLQLRQFVALGWPQSLQGPSSVLLGLTWSWFFRLFSLLLEGLVSLYIFASLGPQISFFIPKDLWPEFIAKISSMGPKGFIATIFYFPLSELLRYGFYKIFFKCMTIFSPINKRQEEGIDHLLKASLSYGLFWALPFIGGMIVFFGQMSFLFRGLTTSIKIPMMILISFFFVPIVFSFVNILFSFIKNLLTVLG
jgi:hypothetical protein